MWPQFQPITNPFDILLKLRSIANSRQFNEYAQAAATHMVGEVRKENDQHWRTASAEIHFKKAQQIHEALKKELSTTPRGAVVQEIIEKNATLIKKDIPADTAKRISETARDMTFQGKRSDEIAEEIKKDLPKITEGRIKLIARTETSKASTALSEARARALNLNWYIWRTSEDGAVRASHKLMDDVLISWDDPPDPESLALAAGIMEKRGNKSYPPVSVGKYHAGNVFNCRCYPENVVSIDIIDFPHKVYTNGVIQRMTKAQFEEIAGRSA